MSNVDDVVQWAQGLGDNCPSVAQITAALNTPPVQVQPHDTPDHNGLVALPGIPADSQWAKVRYGIQEIHDSMPNNQAKANLHANLVEAGIAYRDENGFIGADYVAKLYHTGLTGVVYPREPIPNTLCLPNVTHEGYNLGTVSGATAYYSQLPKSDPGTPDTGPMV